MPVLSRYAKFLFRLSCAAAVLGVSLPAHGQPPLFPTMKERMAYLGERQALIANNIANAHTPKYTAQDLAPFPAAAGQRRLTLATTSPMHMASRTGHGGRFKTVENDTSETTPTGNNVVMDEEMLKASETNLDYQETTNLYKKWGGIMKTAINGARQ